MNWKYCFIHDWETPRTDWMDIFLLPDDAAYEDDALRLSVFSKEWYSVNCDKELYGQILSELNDKEFFIDEDEVYIRAENYTEEEMLNWVKVWFSEIGVTCKQLIKVSYKEFDGRHPQFKIMQNMRGNNLKEDLEIIEKLTKEIEQNPTDANARFNRGIAYMEIEKYSEAILDFNKTIEIDPSNVGAYNNRGNIYKCLECHSEAVADMLMTSSASIASAACVNTRLLWAYWPLRCLSMPCSKRYNTSLRGCCSSFLAFSNSSAC